MPGIREHNPSSARPMIRAALTGGAHRPSPRKASRSAIGLRATSIWPGRRFRRRRNAIARHRPERGSRACRTAWRGRRRRRHGSARCLGDRGCHAGAAGQTLEQEVRARRVRSAALILRIRKPVPPAAQSSLQLPLDICAYGTTTRSSPSACKGKRIKFKGPYGGFDGCPHGRRNRVPPARRPPSS